ncbi:MAG: InlB B-repeat-containing protein, partial [Firmicutes bacterium]|nr:InlB B-repeat-containing protein [Bacillota bacterium]
ADASKRDGQAAGEAFNFNNVVNENTVLYGNWTQATSANYNVVFWFQQVDGEGYDYSGTTLEVRNATVGENTYTISQQGTGDNAYARVYTSASNYTNYNNFTGFHLDHFDAATAVKPDGTTVINVYYNRNTITYTFEGVGSFSGLYGSAFTQWPDPGNNRVWHRDSGLTSIDFPLPLTEFNPAAAAITDSEMSNSEFTFTTSRYSQGYTLRVYKMTTTGAWSYTDSDVIATAPLGDGGTWYPTETYTGYTLDGYYQGNNPSSGRWTSITPSGSIRYNGNLNLRYARNKYGITYSDGVFVNGSGSPVTDAPSARTNFETKDNIYYEANINTADYNIKPTLNGYVFLGWYDNALCAGEPYTFDKMPANNVALYAKWGLREYEINLHPNDSTSDPIQYTNPEQAATFYADEGDKVGNVGGERIYNDLVGWYSDEAMTHSFNFDAMVVNQTTVEKYGTIYSESEIDPEYPTTVGELNLYAKWRSKLIGADGITVEYVDGAEGTSATATDESKYVDGSHANAHGAFTPADMDEYVFSHWEVQKWNGTAYESAGVNVFPGEAFEIKAADAKITDKDGNAKTIEELDKNEKYTYTIQLKAVYVEKDKEILTSINWYNNYDGGKVATSEDIKINQATPIPAAPTRTGYEFKGWIRGFEEDGTTTTLTDLWLTYEDGAYKYNGNPATDVAADEALVGDGTKHHALYAKWEAIDVDYTVEFYYQNDNGEGYTKDETLTDTRQAKTDTTVNATDADKAQTKNDKYKLNAEESTLTATVAGDGTTVLKVYFDLNKVPVTVEHYLKGQTTAFKTDTAADQIVGTTYTATAETIYQGKKLTVDSKNPESGSITVAATDNLIKIYYTLPVTVTAADNKKVYGTEDPAFSATVDGTIGTDTVTYTVTRPGAGTDENVGKYTDAIVPAGENAQGYYTVTYIPADFEITKAPASELGLTATGYTGVYDANNHAASATATVTDGTTIEYSTDGGKTWTKTAPSIKDVGEQAVQARATNPNYEDATASCTLKVTPAPVTVTAVDSTKTYGANDPTFTANVSGVLDDYTITYTVSRPGAGTDENVGTYTDAIVAAGAATQGNYTVTYEPADFVITAAGTLTVTATGYENVYDAASHAASATASVTEGTTIEYSTDGGKTWSTTAPTITDVGEQAVSVRATNPNYVTATAECTLKVTPKPVTVTAKAASKVYGTNDPTFEATVSGTIGSDKVTYDVTRPGAGTDENVGTYTKAVVPAGEATQGNYTVTYVPADFEITKAPASELGLTAEGYEGVYDADSHAASAEATVTEGTTIEYSTDGETWSTTAPTITNVGEQPVRVRATNPNYETATANCTLKVTPKPVTVTAVEASKTYGDADPEFTATVDGTLGTDTVSYTVTRPGAGTDENARKYTDAIVAEGEATQGNYTVTYAPADFTINKAALTIKANDQTYTYNGKPQGENNKTYTDASKVTVTGLKGTDALTSVTLDGQETNAGEYAGKIAASAAQIGEATDNYSITYEAGKLTINPVSDKVTVIITGNKASVDYNGKEQKAEGYEVSIINELYTEKDFTFSGNDVAKGTNKGTYNMGLAKDQFKNTNTNFTNIEFVVTDGELVIKPREITIESAPDKKVYDGTPLTNDTVKITKGELASTDELTNVEVTGSQTLVGTSKNTFTFDIDTKAEPASPAGKLLSALGLLGTAYGSEEVLANYDITKVEGDLTVTDKKVDPDKVITKTHEDKTYKVGETITFTIEATNIYAEKKDITLTEQEGVTLEKSEFKDVEPGAKIETTATYTVTEEDAKAGTFKNTVKITFSGVDDPIENTDEVKDFAHMTVTKAVTNKPADGKVFRTGETIKYEVTVTNDGTKELTDIVVKDELTGDEWKVDSLAAGKSKTFKAEYKVTDKDAAAGNVTNVATAEGKDTEGDTTPGNPGKVVTDTDKAIEPAPKTSDTTVIVPYIVIGVSALALLLMLLFRRRKAN